jgi:hypothetical protein
VKRIARIKFRSWFKSIAFPQNNEYWDFLRQYDFSVVKLITLLDQFLEVAIDVADSKTETLHARNTDFDPFIVLLFKQLGEALDEEYQTSSHKLAATLAEDECFNKIGKILQNAKNINKISSSCKDELTLLEEIHNESSNKHLHQS